MTSLEHCPSCGRWAFLISALLHLTVVTAFLLPNPGGESGGGDDTVVDVNLAMFRTGTQETAATSSPEARVVEEAAPAEDAAADAENEPQPLPAIPSANPLEADHERQAKPPTESARSPEPHTAAPALAPKPPPQPKAMPPRRTTAATSRPPPTNRRRTVAKEEHESRPKRTSSSAAKSSSRAHARRGGRAPGKAHAAGDGAARAAAEGLYLAELQRAIAKHRFYPRAARRRSREGEVTVSFVIQADGRITGIRVTKSSGSDALDRAAVRTLENLGRFRPIPAKIGRTRWALRVPINFALR